MQKKSNAVLYSIIFALFAGGVGLLCLAGFSNDSVYFLTVSEAKAAQAGQLKQARLFGVVSPDGFKNVPGALAFNLADKDNVAHIIRVVYNGVAPDAFKAGAEVIVEGGMGETGDFLATLLMTKCPSKYRKENRGD